MTSSLIKLSKYFSIKRNGLILEIISIVIVLSVTTLLYSFLFKIPSNSVVGDAQRYNGYQAYIVKYSLLHFGQLGLWDQLLGSGMSWISHPGGGQLSPFAWIAILLTDNITRGSLLIFFMPTLTAAISFYFLLRIISLTKITSILVSLLAVSNQYILTFIANGWFEELLGLSLIPSTLGLLWLSFVKRNYLYAVIGGIVMSLNFFSNSYYVFHYNAIVLLWAGGIFIAREFWLRFRKKTRNTAIIKRYIFSNFIFWAVLIGLSAVKLLPLLEFRSISARNALPLHIIETPDGVMSFSFFYALFRNFIIPAGHSDSFTHYANDLAVLFIVIAVLYFIFKKSFKYGMFLGVFGIGLWGYFAYRIPLDLYAFLYKFLPGFSSNNYPYRFIMIINFAFIILVALGMDFLNRRKNKVFLILGTLLGIVIVFSSIKYSSNLYNNLSYPSEVDVDKDAKSFKLQIQKSDNLNIVPKIEGHISENLLTDLSKITKAYEVEGRVYSDFSVTSDNSLVNHIILEEAIPVVHPSYSPIIPTYEFGAIPAPSQSSLEQTRNRFKIFSVLDTRFQYQQKEYFEYNCGNIKMINTTISTKNEVCDYLEKRLYPLIINSKGGIFYDKGVLPKIVMISNPILIISDNRFNDFSGFIAKQIMLHPDFDEHNVTILSGGSSYVDDYTLDILKQFSAVFLVESKAHDKNKADFLLAQYQKNGGKILKPSSKWIDYESLHQRSGSLWTDKPAWNYSKEDSVKISELLKSLSPSKDNLIEIKKYTPEDLLFNVKTASDNQVLQFSDSFYPGWKATIDGRSTPMYMADGLVKGVVVPKGTHLVRLYYDPDSFKIGAMISGVTILILLFFLGHKFIRKK